jgi:hypothetical protein
VAVDALLGEDRKQVFFKAHRRADGTGGKAGDDKKHGAAHRDRHEIGRGGKRKIRAGRVTAKNGAGITLASPACCREIKADNPTHHEH